MKIVIALMFFFFINNCFSQQLLIRVIIESKSKIGYGVEMYYVFNNADEFKHGISNISKFTEREILNAFNYPLVEPGMAFGICGPLDKLQKKNSDFIKKSRRLFMEKSDLRVSVSISSAFVEYCIFYLPNKYWSYDVSFTKAAVITDYKKHSKKISKTTLNEIKILFKKIPD
ncbi:MAG: hypothetical protein N3F09_02670 [Bacteroidia bacterium]|nr:hypothetical protein [Bacteroidia bacterium]